MKKIITLCGLVLLAVAAVLGPIGCETQSASTQISVDPSTATIHQGESIEFTASGGFNYTWSLSNHTLGTLSNTTGPSTTYTSLYDSSASNTAVQVLTCTSDVEGTSSSNSVPDEWSVEVYINHV
jgi:hypothetical protein